MSGTREMRLGVNLARLPHRAGSVNHFISDAVDLWDATAQSSAWNTGGAVRLRRVHILGRRP
jgi:hypothetical protein